MSAISEKYQALGGKEGYLGEATDVEQPCPDGIGRYQHFQNGSIHWSPQSGAHATKGWIREKWAALKWEAGPLGYPITDEEDCPGGRYTLFQAGTILWRQGTTAAFETHGAIRDKWASLGKETGLLGYPETDEVTCPDNRGRFNHFEHGSVYWTEETGAHEVHGAIRERWAQLGWERSKLGYPISDEMAAADGTGRFNEFEKGRISWTPSGGAKEEMHPFKPRVVKAMGKLDLVDHETFGSNEQETISVEVVKTIDTPGVPQEFMRFRRGFGGELRYELDLDVVVHSNGTAVLDGEARLYEGTDESTNDLERRGPVHVVAEPNRSATTGEELSVHDDTTAIDVLVNAIFDEDGVDSAKLNLSVYNLLS